MKKNDKAGVEYWTTLWNKNKKNTPWDVPTEKIKNHPENEIFKLLNSILEEKTKGGNITIVEVGCAQSQILPVFSKKFNLQVSGIDYSSEGCEQAKTILKDNNITGDIHCFDVLDTNKNFDKKFDIVFSFGLVEHFEDTEKIIISLKKLLKPDGVIITFIPNMRGSVGFLQKTLNENIYNIHVPLSLTTLKKCHETSGFITIKSDYLLSNSFGVINIGEKENGNISWFFKKITIALLARVSILVWFFERNFFQLPSSHKFSPYIYYAGQLKNDSLDKNIEAICE